MSVTQSRSLNNGKYKQGNRGVVGNSSHSHKGGICNSASQHEQSRIWELKNQLRIVAFSQFAEMTDSLSLMPHT